MAQRLTIPDDCVFEGYGDLYRGVAEASPPKPLAADTDAVNGGGGGVVYITLEQEEALRQLRMALHVDVPPTLKPPAPEKKFERLAVSPAGPRRLVYPQDAPPLNPMPASSSAGTQYEIGRMKSQCHFLRDWLMCHETPEQSEAAREFVRATRCLLQKDSVRELLGRTENLLQQLEDWPAVVNRARSQIAEWNNDTSLRDLHEFVKDIFGASEACARLAKLTCRFSLLAPLLEEAAFRSAAEEEIERWSSEATVSSLQTLRDSLCDWESRVAEDEQSILDSAQMLLKRIATIKKKRDDALR